MLGDEAAPAAGSATDVVAGAETLTLAAVNPLLLPNEVSTAATTGVSDAELATGATPTSNGVGATEAR